MSTSDKQDDGALPCGIYRTGVDLGGPRTADGLPVVTADRLVYFHNHSTQGPPLVLLPEENENNRWRFSDRGVLVDGDGSAAFLASLVPLPPEGYYVVKDHIHVTGDRILGEKSLLQLGYTREGEPILFPGEFDGLAILFSDRGFRFSDLAVLERLAPGGFVRPEQEEESKTLH